MNPSVGHEHPSTARAVRAGAPPTASAGGALGPREAGTVHAATNLSTSAWALTAVKGPRV
jgi:hypothetical protein